MRYLAALFITLFFSSALFSQTPRQIRILAVADSAFTAQNGSASGVLMTEAVLTASRWVCQDIDYLKMEFNDTLTFSNDGYNNGSVNGTTSYPDMLMSYYLFGQVQGWDSNNEFVILFSGLNSANNQATWAYTQSICASNPYGIVNSNLLPNRYWPWAIGRIIGGGMQAPADGDMNSAPPSGHFMASVLSLGGTPDTTFSQVSKDAMLNYYNNGGLIDANCPPISTRTNCDFSSEPIDTTTSILNFTQDASTISLYPNPASSSVWISGEPTTVTIFNSQGRAISTITVNEQATELNLLDWPKGIYLVQPEKGAATRFIVK